jgi:single-stranded DNA-binding protein
MSETERVTLVGNLTADPELRSTPTGLEVANLRLAVTPRGPGRTTAAGPRARPASTPSLSGATRPPTPPRPFTRAPG